MTIRHNLQIRQGETWEFTHTHLDADGDAIDLTGYTARMALKSSFNQVLGSNVAYLSTGSDANGGSLTLGGVAGTVLMEMTAAQSANLSSGLPTDETESTFNLVYDLELINGAGDVVRALEGRVTVVKEITS